MNPPLRGTVPDLEDPKYKLHFRSRTLNAEKKVTTAEVQFWQEHAETFLDSLEEHDLPRNLARVDLLTNEYYPQHVRRLDRNGNGPILENTLEALENMK